MECSVVDCDKLVQARGWCHAHYMRWYKRGGDPAENRRTKAYIGPRTACSVVDCEDEVEGWGWCKTHYQLAARIYKVYPRTCDHCEKPYVGRRSDSRFCTRECKAKEREKDGRAAASVRKWQMKDRYGLEPADYHRMLSEQGGGCAICGTFDPQGRGRFHIDHDHTNGRIRGLLCTECNIGLGKFKDDPELVRKAVDYLDR